MKLFASFLIISLIVIEAEGFSINPIKSAGNLDAQMAEIDYPSDLEKNLDNGFTTRLFVDLKLIQDEHELDHVQFELRVFYDLWAEDFIVKIFKGDSLQREVKMKDKSEVIKILENLRLAEVIPLNRLTAHSHYKFEVQMLLNPIGREKVEKIKKWVADNSVTNTLDSSGRSVPTTHRGKLDAVFSTIFNQYTEGENEIGVWRKDGNSQSFQLKDVTTP